MTLFARRRLSILFIVLTAAFLFLAIPYGFALEQATPTPAMPQATITVNSTLDVVADDGVCTLREAITAANTDTASGALAGECAAGNGADVIMLDPGTYTLALPGAGEDANASGDLDIDSGITLQGVAGAVTTIDGAALDRVLHVLPDAELYLENLVIQGGLAADENGGGIYHAGDLLSINNSVVVSNTAAGGFPNGRGGGIWSSGLITLTFTAVTDNNAARDGGGLYNTGSMWLVATNLIENTADLNGGGAYNSAGDLHLVNATVSGNETLFSGGGINNRGSLSLHNSNISGNTADLSGGGLYNSTGGDVYVQDTRFSLNDSAEGGAVYTRDGSLTLLGSTLTENTAVSGASLYTRDTPTTIANSTFSGNEASENGGALVNEAVNGMADVTLTHVSLVDNMAVTAGSSLATVGETAVITLSNSLLTTPSAAAAHCTGAGTITSAGYNLVSDTSCALTATGDQVVTIPLVAELADNGGPTLTHALLSDTPAIDHIPEGVNGCGTIWTTDQRGVARPQRSGCDVGAYEKDITVYAIYLPLIRSTPEDVLIAPDLIVEEITVTSDNVQIVIANQGTGAVMDSFWIDLYINPNPAPTEVNQTWDQLCVEGLVWGVADPAALTPGGTLTLTLDDANFAAELSDFSGTFTTGMEVYVQVDSANQARESGGVLETHEILDQPYNNIAHVTVALP
ncbi:MAG: CSLREA domain-containing protein [Ardenticatenaceae bacterium]|nr:CSLREA domain-containing protein [Ardenticatenaceae bacterium]